jgi:hypothetical protein
MSPRSPASLDTTKPRTSSGDTPNVPGVPRRGCGALCACSSGPRPQSYFSSRNERPRYASRGRSCPGLRRNHSGLRSNRGFRCHSNPGLRRHNALFREANNQLRGLNRAGLPAHNNIRPTRTRCTSSVFPNLSNRARAPRQAGGRVRNTLQARRATSAEPTFCRDATSRIAAARSLPDTRTARCRLAVRRRRPGGRRARRAGGRRADRRRHARASVPAARFPTPVVGQPCCR